ncbi:MAG: ParB/RepB/Spo0J family partition protein [Acidobacteriota bacterium]|nr:ParB/RepB/Spo0J family partition protein [Acidobacteriota bacterium]
MNPTDTCTASLNFGQDELSRTEILEISLRAIRPDPGQPRRYFDEEALAELRDSMALYGLLQPVGVRQAADGGWELIFGERRYRAAISLGWKTIPARVFPVEAQRIKTVLQLGENAHRADLSLLEYLGGIEQLRDLGVPAGAMARMLCKSDEWVAAMMAISRDPLARSLYEAGIMTQVGAWEAFCRLPEHLRNGLLQSGEQLTIQRCRKVLDAHEAQMSGRQQGLLQETGPSSYTSSVGASAVHAESSKSEKAAQMADDPGESAEPFGVHEQGVASAKDQPDNEIITVALPLWLARALVPEREVQLQQIAEWVPRRDGIPDAIRTALDAVEQDLIQVISGFAGGRP